MRTAQALYGLHIDAFLEGLTAEAPKAEAFGLTEPQAIEVRRNRYTAKICDQRERKTA
jgi:hypothetical protein